jgi:metal-sulfur cluster biosynthetic enzyme
MTTGSCRPLNQPAESPEVLSRVMDVRSAISTVRDPEIDETVEALQFVVDVEVADDLAIVWLRLPTFWCPANFVFLMAGEMRSAVLALPWARRFELRLVDHFAADEINRAVSAGLEFTDAFPEHAVANLHALRRAFDEKAFLMRQSALVSALRAAGLTDDAIVGLTAEAMGDFATSGEIAAAWSAYREKWQGLHGPARSTRLIVDLDDEPIEAGNLPDHLRRIRRLTTGASANGEMCRMLMASRRGNAVCGAPRNKA